MSNWPGRSGWMLLAACLLGQSGCRCCCLLEPYATILADIKDYPVVWDSFYNPRFDISRAGKPDWCGPINSHLAPCRCDCVPAWKRFDAIWLYPPRYVYDFPGHAYPAPINFEADRSRHLDGPEMERLTDDLVPPGPLPEPPVPQAP